MTHEETNQGKETVIITINNVEFKIHRGHHTVAEIKALANVPLAYDLNLVDNGKFIVQPDEGGVTIKGGEEFITNAKDGASS
jgi:hypothetical protein